MKSSEQLFSQSQEVIPGGVNSPVRSFSYVGGTPPFIARGSGSSIEDVEGNSYIDYVMSWGPLILGHAHPDVVEALTRQVKLGTSYGAPTELELQLATLICEAIPSVELVRLVSSGTEAAMSAMRLARAFTGRDKILKFEGCYHGHADGMLVKAGSGAALLPEPTSAGVTATQSQDTLVASYNDLQSVEALYQQQGEDIAAIIVEPVAGNMGLVLPEPGFLEGLRKITSDHQSLLIFDEVITGFRVQYGGVQSLYGINPDLTCLGKVIGGGLPVGAYGGKNEVMQMVAPLGPAYQAGTLSGNPLAVTAGLATLRALQDPQVYENLSAKTQALRQGIEQVAAENGTAITMTSIGSMWNIFFTDHPAKNYADVQATRSDLYPRFFHRMLKRGVYLPPSPFETYFVSTAHTDQDVDDTMEAVRIALRELH